MNVLLLPLDEVHVERTLGHPPVVGEGVEPLSEVNVADSLVADAVAVEGDSKVAIGDEGVLTLDGVRGRGADVLPVVLPVVRCLALFLNEDLEVKKKKKKL